jgi:hypothetical protein
MGSFLRTGRPLQPPFDPWPPGGGPAFDPLGLGTGGSAASYASSPAPSGYRWDFVTENGERVTEDGWPVVELVRVS